MGRQENHENSRKIDLNFNHVRRESESCTLVCKCGFYMDVERVSRPAKSFHAEAQEANIFGGTQLLHPDMACTVICPSCLRETAID